MNPNNNLQVGPDGNLRHLLSTEGLPAEMIRRILDTADQFVSVSERDVKKVPLLRGKSVFNVFFEGSTRTRTTFEIAAKRLSADVINLNVAVSSTSKGETLLDTVYNLQAMDADMFVVRHSESGAPHLIARHVKPGVAVINAGDGRHAHPTQGLLDMYTIRHYKKDFSALTVAIVGDVMHSRVARSQIHALKTLGVPDLRVIGPKTLLPKDVERLGVRVFHDMAEGLKGCDVVIMLRLQNERMTGPLLPSAGLRWTEGHRLVLPRVRTGAGALREQGRARSGHAARELGQELRTWRRLPPVAGSGGTLFTATTAADGRTTGRRPVPPAPPADAPGR